MRITHPVGYTRSEYHTQLANTMSFDEIFDLTAGGVVNVFYFFMILLNLAPKNRLLRSVYVQSDARDGEEDGELVSRHGNDGH